MVDLRQPLAARARRVPSVQIAAVLGPTFTHRSRTGTSVEDVDLFGSSAQLDGVGVSSAEWPRLSVRPVASLLYLKHAFNLSDEELVERWAERVRWQYFSGNEYYAPRPPCDAAQIGRLQRAIRSAGVEKLLNATIYTTLAAKPARPNEFERVIVDMMVREKAIARPADNSRLEIARHKVINATKVAGIQLNQAFAAEGKRLHRRTGGYPHVKQLDRLRRVLKRQRTVLGTVLREVQRKLATATTESDATLHRLRTLFERDERIRAQRPNDKLYAMHATAAKCIGAGNDREPYEFGVKASIAVTHRRGLIVGARTFPGNPYTGHILAAQLEQTNILLEDVGCTSKQVVVDSGSYGVDADNPGVEIIHRGCFRSMTAQLRRWLKRRIIEPAIGHLKTDHRMNRLWLARSLGDALHAVPCAAGCSLRWLLRRIVPGRIGRLFRPWVGSAAAFGIVSVALSPSFGRSSLAAATTERVSQSRLIGESSWLRVFRAN